MSQAPHSELNFVGIDLGGTNVKVGVVDNSGRSLSYVHVPTHAERGPEQGVENIYRTVERAIDEADLKLEQITAIGVAVPGILDIHEGLLLMPYNLRGWENLPIRQQIAERFDKFTILQNDANAAAYGEYWIGAGRSARSLIMWTLGTGIGCGIILDGLIIEGDYSHGGEAGHIIIEMNNGRLCDTGQFGTLEAYAGAKYLVRHCRKLIEKGEHTILNRWMEQGEELTPLLIGKAAEHGDTFADDLIMELARYMGIGTTSMMAVVDPSLVLLGGAMTFGRNETELGRRFIGRIHTEIKHRAFPIPAARMQLRYASLGSDAGYIGAAGCARMKYRRSLG